MLILGAGRRSSSVRDCFMIIMLPGKDPRPAGVRAARVRCGRSSLRGVAGSDRRRRRVLLRLVRGGRGRGSAAPSSALKAGAVGGVVGGHVLLYHSMQLV